MKSLDDIDLKHKKVILREDFNVPVKGGFIVDSTRIDAALPTLKKILEQDAKLLILSHLGRPQANQFDPALSLAPVAKYLSEKLNCTVSLERDWLKGIDWTNKQVVLAENVRFLAGEKENDLALAEAMATGFDVFVMDAFACAHRAHASTVGITQFVPHSCAGPLLLKEIKSLDAVIADPQRPLVAIIGGSKVSSKITLLEKLLAKVDYLIVGGGIANTFIAAAGYDVGNSLVEPDYIAKAQEWLNQYPGKIPLPVDVITAKSLNGDAQIKQLTEIADEDMIFDIGMESIERYAPLIKEAGTIIWNGPVGVFENIQFSKGTQAIAQCVAASVAYSLVGGGDTIAAVNQFGVTENINYISTGGGAFLSYLEGETLPALKSLNEELLNETTH